MTHQHVHTPPGETLRHVTRAFVLGITLNLAFVIVEFVAGLVSGSLALLSDASHNLSDVATLGLSLFAFRIAKRKADSRYTYGFHKASILASLANAVILLIAVGGIGWEATQRLMHPHPAQGNTISLVAGIGIAVNAFSALLFYRDRHTDLNIKGAYLHLAADALVSVGVVVAGFVISSTQLLWIDPFVSLLIMVVVLRSTWGLLTESLKLSMDAVPSGIDGDRVKQKMEQIAGVQRVHHLHIWALSTTRNAMTAHIIVDKTLTNEQVAELKTALRHVLEHNNITHATLETEHEH